jgi:cytoplasmic iron level regulating protein YaaA (DUF328/UPF0246 family)
MITLLTPSKTMNFHEAAPAFAERHEPLFAQQANEIRQILGRYRSNEIEKLMHVSPSIAQRVVTMYGDLHAAKPALWTYIGDVFKGFQARTIDQKALKFAEDHLLIISAVYGLVRPCDAIRPYRLEMRAGLSVDRSTNSLYGFWGDTLTRYVETLSELRQELCVLSSKEYARVVVSQLSPSVQVATPRFIDRRANGQEAQIPIYNKLMRGVMARWIVDNEINSLKALDTFSAHGYCYSKERSTPSEPTFFREVMTPLVLTEL